MKYYLQKSGKTLRASVIVVKSDEGLCLDVCLVRVLAEKIPVNGVIISMSGASMRVGSRLWLFAIVTPLNAADTDVVWSANNSSVARVDANGIVTAVGQGTAVITVTTGDGGYVASCTVGTAAGLSTIGRRRESEKASEKLSPATTKAR